MRVLALTAVVATLVALASCEITMSVTPTLLSQTGDWVNVSWTGVDSPNATTDWVGVFTPGNVEVSTIEPADWPATPPWTDPLPNKFVMAQSNEDGSGWYRFKLVNMRSDYVFKFFRNGTWTPTEVATSNTVSFKYNAEPTFGHIALTNDSSVMRVAWVSGNVTNPTLKWGTSPGSYTHSTLAYASTYTADDLCGFPGNSAGWRDPGMLYNAFLTGVKPGVTYYYMFGSTMSGGWSAEFNFTGPKPPAPETATKFIIYGDMGQGQIDNSSEHWEEQAALNTTKWVLAEEGTDVIAHIGDLSYAVGYAAAWEEFGQEIQPVATHVPYMTCLGNHERDWPDSGSFFTGYDSGGECGVPTEARFVMPTPNGNQDDAWYSFEIGNIHMTVMSTEHPCYPGTPQYEFLATDMANVNRSLTPWLFFTGHRPMYASNYGVPQGEEDVRVALETLLYNNKVDACFWGHVHDYERTCAIYNFTCVDTPDESGYTAPVHFVTGAGGMALTPLEASSLAPEWSLARKETHGYSRVMSANSTAMHFQFVQSSTGEVLDDMWITK